MGIFSKLFKRNTSKEHHKNIEENTVIKSKPFNIDDLTIIRPLNENQKKAIDQTSISLRSAQLYMHYSTDNIVPEDINDSIYQNTVLFFWKAEEPFPKKSLPPEFNSYQAKYFIFKEKNLNVSIQIGQAIPWFGMPGLGEKHVCEMDSQKIVIPKLHKKGIVQYCEHVELRADNLNVLTNRKNYIFLINENMVSFRNNNFYVKDKLIPISLAYMIGGIQLLKISN